MIRILFIADGITPFTIGGMQRHSQNLVRELIKSNEVELCLGFTVNWNEKIPSENEVLEALECSDDSKGSFTFHTFKFPVVKKIPGHYVRSSKSMSTRMFEAFKSRLEYFDVIYCKGLLGWEFTKSKANRLHNVPVISNFHGYEMFQEAPNVKTKLQHILILRNAVRSIMNRADYVVSYGAKITELLMSIGYNKIIEIPSGISDELIASQVEIHDGDRIKVVFLGRFERRKGIKEIHESINLYNEELKQKIDFHFIGPIPETEKVIADNVIYYGSIRDFGQIKVLLDEMDVLICPSYSEGMPNVILESMARGLAVIATDVGAVSLLVDNDNGILLPNVSSSSIKSALVDLDRITVNKQRENSLTKIKAFKWSEIAKVTIRKLKEVINEGN